MAETRRHRAEAAVTATQGLHRRLATLRSQVKSQGSNVSPLGQKEKMDRWLK